MACLYPVSCYRAIRPNERGKRPLLHKEQDAISAWGASGYQDFKRPCGVCIECRLLRSRNTAIRCVHEASLHDRNCFLTLTLSNEYWRPGMSLSTRDMQLFWKKLRKRSKVKLKYLAAGEYGEGEGERHRFFTHKTGEVKKYGDNPHYHACVFGFDFDDKVPAGTNENGDTLYSSKTLDEIWGKGRCIIGDVTFESAAYVARYTLKKIYGDEAEDFYQGRMPERPWWSQGIGKSWFAKWYTDVYPSDTLVIRGGKVCMPPPYYDALLLKHDPALYEDVRNSREKIFISKNNFDTVYNSVNHRPMSVSEVVRRAQLRVGRLDAKR